MRAKIRRVATAAAAIPLCGILLFTAVVFIAHRVKTSEETALLKEKGYYNPVSVGEYSLNVARFGNEDGRAIVAMAGLGTGDFDVTARKATAVLEKDDLVVFVDRAGYGFSEDTSREMTLENVVEDYRAALRNSGTEPPYILLPHSIAGAYATYWVSKYPEEIEAVVFMDGSQLSENAFEDYDASGVGFGDRFSALLAKLGFSRFVLRDYFYLLSDDYTDEEQRLADALELMTLDSIAPISEDAFCAENARKAFNEIVPNDVPKLYICSSWGLEDEASIREYSAWVDRQAEKNGLEGSSLSELTEEQLRAILEQLRRAREEIIYPYAEKMGNCEVVCLGGDHTIYEQKPDECGRIIKEFIDNLPASE